MLCTRVLVVATAALAGVGACTSEAPVHPVATHVVAVTGEVVDAASTRPITATSVLDATATFDLQAKSALTLRLQNGCVAHVIGPMTIALSSLSTTLAEPCPESLDEQLRLLGGVDGATVTLSERTSAAGQDHHAFRDATSASSSNRASPDGALQKPNAGRAQPGVASASDETPANRDDPSPPNVGSSASGASLPPNDAQLELPIGKRPVTTQEMRKKTDKGRQVEAVVEPITKEGKEGQANANTGGTKKPDSDTKKPPHRTERDAQRDAGAGALDDGGVDDVPVRAPLHGVVVRSSAFERMVSEDAFASCRAAIAKAGSPAIHAVVADGRIREVRLEGGPALSCTDVLVGRALPLANGIAVARMAPRP
jgi:hypothetical protein